MKIIFPVLIWLLSLVKTHAQTNSYAISFENAVHHEAVIEVVFPQLGTDTLSLRMSRTSPGRYALHEFAKNIYGFRATDSRGRDLMVHRPNPYEWEVGGHDGTVKVEYILFANRGDGTYSQIDETHAHLNIPATFIYAPDLRDREIEVTFLLPEGLNWQVATQLPKVSGTTYSAPGLYYFMDSPAELSDFEQWEFKVSSRAITQTIRLVLHHDGSSEEGEAYFEKVRKIVLEEMEVYGELPEFDYGTYTFLACYLPQVSGDGMEHRNSTILTSTRPLGEGGQEQNIGTVSHEFFHAWNVERLRPRSLEPFDFEEANMSGSLWFAEGFTSYYTDLILCRAGLLSQEQYAEGLSGTFNVVWNSPARRFFNPVEMSYQAPFVDAATSMDPVNRENTFISYYAYGSVLGLALDLSLRERGLSLDGYMKQLWDRFGRKEIPYLPGDLRNTLATYADEEFATGFFDQFIRDSQMPDYTQLLNSVGLSLYREPGAVYLGLSTGTNADNQPVIQGNPLIDSPVYRAGLERGDVIISLDSITAAGWPSLGEYLKQKTPGDTLRLSYLRNGKARKADLILAEDPSYHIELQEKRGEAPGAEALRRRNAWLKKE